MSRAAGRGLGGQPAALTQDLPVVALPSPGSIHEGFFLFKEGVWPWE